MIYSTSIKINQKIKDDKTVNWRVKYRWYLHSERHLLCFSVALMSKPLAQQTHESPWLDKSKCQTNLFVWISFVLRFIFFQKNILCQSWLVLTCFYSHLFVCEIIEVHHMRWKNFRNLIFFFSGNKMSTIFDREFQKKKSLFYIALDCSLSMKFRGAIHQYFPSIDNVASGIFFNGSFGRFMIGDKIHLIIFLSFQWKEWNILTN